MAYNVKQISAVVVDAAKDALGKSVSLTKLDTSDFVTLGKTLASYNVLDGWFGALTNRLIKTIYFVRTYKGSNRHILRDEHDYGAFVQKVYYKMPDAVDNPEYDIPDGNGDYTQASPYDVDDSIEVSALIFGAKGTWSYEIVRPVSQIKSAFLSPADMMAFIDGIYVVLENKIKFDEERLVATAANTSMASVIKNGNAINVLNLYNMENDANVITVDEILTHAGFLKRASMEIATTIDNMKDMSTLFNANGYETFTDKENLVVEMLTRFAKASDMYLQADTFHNELVKLPNFESVNYWQRAAKNYPFDVCSSIKIKNADLADADVVGDDGTVEQSGIICFLHDIENVAAYFGDRRSWELPNPRSNVIIHGEAGVKGFAVDNNANAVVFYVENTNPITATAGSTLKYSHAYAGILNEITVPHGDAPTATDVVFTKISEGASYDVYSFTPATNDAITITVA